MIQTCFIGVILTKQVTYFNPKAKPPTRSYESIYSYKEVHENLNLNLNHEKD